MLSGLLQVILVKIGSSISTEMGDNIITMLT